MNGEPNDDELQRRLGAVDPASSVPPADPAWVARLLEETMSDQLTNESRSDGTHHRSRLTWIVAAAAVVLIAAGVGFGLANRGDEDPQPSADENLSGQAKMPQASVTRLRFDPASAQARCMVPDADVISQQTLAFEGTVESISGGMVTLEPSRFFTGEESDLVTVKAPSADLRRLLVAVRFEEGGRYLVAATDGQVAVCMISAAYSDDLAGLYEQAFAK